MSTSSKPAAQKHEEDEREQEIEVFLDSKRPVHAGPERLTRGGVFDGPVIGPVENLGECRVTAERAGQDRKQRQRDR